LFLLIVEEDPFGFLTAFRDFSALIFSSTGIVKSRLPPFLRRRARAATTGVAGTRASAQAARFAVDTARIENTVWAYGIWKN
jgi:hypothetical protein